MKYMNKYKQIDKSEVWRSLISGKEAYKSKTLSS